MLPVEYVTWLRDTYAKQQEEKHRREEDENRRRIEKERKAREAQRKQQEEEAERRRRDHRGERRSKRQHVECPGSLKLTRAGLLRRFFIATEDGGLKALYSLTPTSAAAIGVLHRPLQRKSDSVLTSDPFVLHQLAINSIYVQVEVSASSC